MRRLPHRAEPGDDPDRNGTLIRILDRVQAQLAALNAVVPDTSGMEPHKLRMMRLLGEPGRGGIAAASAEHERRVGESRREEVTTALPEEYLSGI